MEEETLLKLQSCLKKYGIEIVNENNEHRRYLVRGGQKYKAMDSNVEGDWSQGTISSLPMRSVHRDFYNILQVVP